jgi:hypothetical protein
MCFRTNGNKANGIQVEHPNKSEIIHDFKPRTNINALRNEKHNKTDKKRSNNELQQNKNAVVTSEERKSQNLHNDKEEEKITEIKEESREVMEKPN